jgi:hypothetical protein
MLSVEENIMKVKVLVLLASAIAMIGSAVSAQVPRHPGRHPGPGYPGNGQYSPAARRALELADKVQFQLSRSVQYLSEEELRDIVASLESADQVINGQAPIQNGPACGLKGYGTYKGYYFSYMVTTGDEVVDATNSLTEALGKITKLQQAGVCSTRNRNTCSMDGYGTYKGYYFNYKILLNGEVVDSTNEFTDLTQKLNALRAANLCRVRATEKCELNGRGTYKGYYFDYLIAVGGNTVDGSNDFNAATSRLTQLRSLGICQ